ncbi:Urease operon transcriptional activator [Serratia entomophila]|uniref:helix-turn-helix transcriptional regulator n=1 Tax=Serratia entomophila TaxID=42906 RepID=UPI0021785D2A|nr:AraC family transcriptional regulator [Serratia entomophila]CAI1568101.1 Urease operon transcriptional activator [Serratia entomophila]
MSSDQISLSSALSARLTLLGVDIERVGQLAGLPAGLFSERREKIKLSTRQFFDIWRALARLADDAAFGLRLGGDVSPEHYDIASVAALHSATLGEALQKVARYKRLLCPEELMLVEDGDSVRLPGLEAELAKSLQSKDLPDQVMAILGRTMRGQRPSVNSVAAELYISPRTLQRRLQQHGYSYQQLLDKTRHRTACQLLADTDLEPGEIAFVLGFEEMNSFSRAFMQWESQTPNRWRTQRSMGKQENRI